MRHRGSIRTRRLTTVAPGAPRRDTRQRRAIRSVFRAADGPLSPDEVLARGQAVVPSLGVATVYRNLKALAEDGWLVEVSLPGGGVRHELATRPHHHHFLCRSCDQAFDIHRCPDGVEALSPKGFEVEGHELILYGRCATCRDPRVQPHQALDPSRSR